MSLVLLLYTDMVAVPQRVLKNLLALQHCEAPCQDCSDCEDDFDSDDSEDVDDNGGITSSQVSPMDESYSHISRICCRF